jgi:hypothetical protein
MSTKFARNRIRIRIGWLILFDHDRGSEERLLNAS